MARTKPDKFTVIMAVIAVCISVYTLAELNTPAAPELPCYHQLEEPAE